MTAARYSFTVTTTIALSLLSSLPSYAQGTGAVLSPGYRFSETSGEALFTNVCSGCHMPDGKGASGAGAYPSLADDAALKAGGYPVYVVVNGQRAMPPFGDMMSDDQVAAVVNYLRTHFGNHYQDGVTVEDAKIVRR